MSAPVPVQVQSKRFHTRPYNPFIHVPVPVPETAQLVLGNVKQTVPLTISLKVSLRTDLKAHSHLSKAGAKRSKKMFASAWCEWSFKQRTSSRAGSAVHFLSVKVCGQKKNPLLRLKNE